VFFSESEAELQETDSSLNQPWMVRHGNSNATLPHKMKKNRIARAISLQLGMCGNPKVGSVSDFRNPNRTVAKKSNPKFRFPRLFWKLIFWKPIKPSLHQLPQYAILVSFFLLYSLYVQSKFLSFKTCFLSIRDLRCIRNTLDYAHNIYTYLIHSKPDYSNSLFLNLPVSTKSSSSLSLSLKQSLNLPNSATSHFF